MWFQTVQYCFGIVDQRLGIVDQRLGIVDERLGASWDINNISSVYGMCTENLT